MISLYWLKTLSCSSLATSIIFSDTSDALFSDPLSDVFTFCRTGQSTNSYMNKPKNIEIVIARLGTHWSGQLWLLPPARVFVIVFVLSFLYLCLYMNLSAALVKEWRQWPASPC